MGAVGRWSLVGKKSQRQRRRRMLLEHQPWEVRTRPDQVGAVEMALQSSRSAGNWVRSCSDHLHEKQKQKEEENPTAYRIAESR